MVDSHATTMALKMFASTMLHERAFVCVRRVLCKHTKKQTNKQTEVSSVSVRLVIKFIYLVLFLGFCFFVFLFFCFFILVFVFVLVLVLVFFDYELYDANKTKVGQIRKIACAPYAWSR